MATLVIELVLLSIFFQGKITKGESHWSSATTTLYSNNSDLTHGACGYNIIDAKRADSTAVSEPLFAEGAACGQCYEIECNSRSDGYKSCIERSSVVVRATSFFPTNYSALLSDDETGFELASEHFHISQSAWEKISSRPAGVAPVLYRRFPCIQQGGVQFTINGKDFFTVVRISNIAGDGSTKSVSIKGSDTKWIRMSRNYGANWQSNVCLKGQSVSFSVTLTDGQNIVFNSVVPAGWSFGKTFSSPSQFDN